MSNLTRYPGAIHSTLRLPLTNRPQRSLPSAMAPGHSQREAPNRRGAGFFERPRARIQRAAGCRHVVYQDDSTAMRLARSQHDHAVRHVGRPAGRAGHAGLGINLAGSGQQVRLVRNIAVSGHPTGQQFRLVVATLPPSAPMHRHRRHTRRPAADSLSGSRPACRPVAARRL